MIFKFENVGIIKEAEIEVGGLTVLTGLNDIGKSFISRTIFSIITAKELGQEYWLNLLLDLIQAEIDLFKQRITQIDNRINIFQLPGIENFYSNLADSILAGEEEISNFFSGFKNTLISVSLSMRIPEDKLGKMKKATEEFLKVINNILTNEIKQKEKVLGYYFDWMWKREFQNQFNHSGQIARIKISDQDGSFSYIEIENEKTSKMEFTKKFYINNATIIESPLILELSPFIRNTLLADVKPRYNRNKEERADIHYHLLDLVYKLSGSTMNLKYITEQQSLIDIINKMIYEVIGGKVTFDPYEHEFYFNTADGRKIKSGNIATGIKSFAIIQLLLFSGINPNSVLIIDEPEVHLHPDWQVEFVKLILLLVQNDSPIIVSTHSPYILRAIKSYSEDQLSESVVKYYLGEKLNGDNRVTYRNVSENLEPVFKLLAHSMQKISFES